MKKALYIGIYSDGSTSKMRADIIRNIISDWEFTVIDTDVPKRKMSRLWQSIGFRYKKGPLIGNVNKYIINNLGNQFYDLIWVDKAIYITYNTTLKLRNQCENLIHFTPDPAFAFHRSKLFFDSIKLYDFVITTKSFELDNFSSMIGDARKVLYVTQGFDKYLHRPITEWKDKKGVAFIGHFEADRSYILKSLLEKGFYVTLAGIGWEKFIRTYNFENINYLGRGVFGNDYVQAISNSLYALGSVSKWIPEMHTTRTFEIPACKTALLTEKNDEIATFFNDDEVIYYNDVSDLIKKIEYYNNHKSELKELIDKGYNRVQTGGFDYESIIRRVFVKMHIL